VNIDVIRSGIRGDIGKKIFFYDTVGSTNTVALDLAEGSEEGAVVMAERQEKGRGRAGRAWISPPGVNVYLSIILHPRLHPEQLTLLTLLSAVACTHALRKTTGLDISVKWPNDLVVSDRKLGGILTETKGGGDQRILAVIGIGINVNMELSDFPLDISATATSVKNETGRIVVREPIVSEILNETARWYALMRTGAVAEITSEWQRLTSTLGRQVVVTTGGETYTGLAEAIDESGLLLMRLPSGAVKRISSGDLTVLR
jgi:BirA family biotin operon repressor/biotin-[acetyl-CoA-carboxylase] ligase